MDNPLDSVRLDLWLSAARFYKTRSRAAKACEGGKVKVNGSSARPHKFLHVGDEITLHVHGQYRDIRVEGLARRGLPAAEARKLYTEKKRQTLSSEEEELLALYRKLDKKQTIKYKGRPTKKERRNLDKWREG